MAFAIDEQILWKGNAYIIVVEFQKSELTHTYRIFFLTSES